jgi:uncharacterized protein (TIGR03000 family)
MENVPKIQEKDSKDRMKEKIGMAITPDRAVVAVRLPADATLFADGKKTDLTSTERLFMTPSLQLGQRYQYELKVEYIRDGKPISESKTVFVKAGERTDVEFVDVGIAKNEKVSSKVTVLLPKDAKLFVENRSEPFVSLQTEFQTPELPKGQEFSYLFRAEIVREGKKQSQTQQVIFKAGDPIKVDFTDMDSVRTVSK